MSISKHISRRDKLARKIGQDSIAIISSGKQVKRNADVNYRFRPNSSFYYLTGSNDPDSILVIVGGKKAEAILFSHTPNIEEERWTGPCLGQSGAMQILKMQAAYSITELPSLLPKLCQGKSHIYYPLGDDMVIEPLILKIISDLKTNTRSGTIYPQQLNDLNIILSEMRLFKDTYEIAAIQKACDISIKAHQRAMHVCSTLHFEHQLEAELLYVFAQNGCKHQAYDAIVAAGHNACTLHYTANNSPLNHGELVLIDAACEYENYAADITRTFPINGIFSPRQRDLYEIVLYAQRDTISKIKPGISWSILQKNIVKIMTAGLRDLGILKGSLDSLLDNHAYKPFYMHSSGHWLGLDVHDVGLYKQGEHWRKLAPNMIFTVEPGLYITKNPDVDEKWWNIGIRIEDDILVTENSHINLTAALPATIKEIEAILYSNKSGKYF